MLTTIFEDKFLEGKAESIIDILKMRFKRQVPKSISNKVLAVRDSIALASLMQSALSCKSFKDFSQDL